VALKVILHGEFAGELSIRRFQFEAQAAANLEHPNIVPIYEVGEVGNCHFFSMRLIKGGDLEQNREAFQFLSTEHAKQSDKKTIRARQENIARLFVKIANAVQFAHQHAILHRDLKPSNILLDENGEPMFLPLVVGHSPRSRGYPRS